MWQLFKSNGTYNGSAYGEEYDIPRSEVHTKPLDKIDVAGQAQLNELEKRARELYLPFAIKAIRILTEPMTSVPTLQFRTRRYIAVLTRNGRNTSVT